MSVEEEAYWDQVALELAEDQARADALIAEREARDAALPLSELAQESEGGLRVQEVLLGVFLDHRPASSPEIRPQVAKVLDRIRRDRAHLRGMIRFHGWARPPAVVVPPRTSARPRGSGRPAGRVAARSSARSGDSGSDSDSDEPARGGLPSGQAVCPLCGNEAIVRSGCPLCGGYGYIEREARNRWKRGLRP